MLHSMNPFDPAGSYKIIYVTESFNLQVSYLDHAIFELLLDWMIMYHAVLCHFLKVQIQ